MKKTSTALLLTGFLVVQPVLGEEIHELVQKGDLTEAT